MPIISIDELERLLPRLREAEASSRAAGTSLVTLLHPAGAPTSAPTLKPTHRKDPTAAPSDDAYSYSY